MHPALIELKSKLELLESRNETHTAEYEKLSDDYQTVAMSIMLDSLLEDEEQ